MNREVWEFLREGKQRVIREWLDESKISARDRAKLDFSLERLRTLDFALVGTKLLAGPLRGGTKLYKLRVRCESRELRPMLCRGPVGAPLDYTLLQGAIEVDNHRLQPTNAEDRAGQNRELLIKNPKWRELY
jgi:hypothetical protein